VQVDAPGAPWHKSLCEIRPFFEFEDFAPSEAVERRQSLEEMEFSTWPENAKNAEKIGVFEL
jgi:hypothetical protein